MIIKYLLSVPIFLLIILSCSTDKIDPKQKGQSDPNMDKPDHEVRIFLDVSKDRDSLKVRPAKLKVKRGHKVRFESSQDFDTKIGFFDSEIFNITGWVTIKKGSIFEVIVNDSAKVDTYYYAVVCKFDDGEYWYAKGNSCPAMIVER